MVFEEKPESFKPLFSVVSCIFDWKSKTLLLRRRKEKSEGGKWGMPSGKIEQGEDIYDAMVREIREETSIEIKKDDLNLFKKFYVDTLGKQFDYYLFYLIFDDKPTIQINKHEHDQSKWVPIQEVLSERLVADHPHCMKVFLEEYKTEASF